jgi:hypothetical protein
MYDNSMGGVLSGVLAVGAVLPNTAMANGDGPWLAVLSGTATIQVLGLSVSTSALLSVGVLMVALSAGLLLAFRGSR